MKTVEELVLTFLLNALWQVPLVALAAAGAARLLRRAPARFHFLLWLFALVLALALPAVSVRSALASRLGRFGPQTESAGREQQAGAPANSGRASWLEAWLGSGFGAGAVPVRRTSQWSEAAALGVTAAYGGAVAFLSLRLLLSGIALRRLSRRSRPLVLAPEDRDLLERCGAAFRLGRSAPALRSSGEIASPVTFGGLGAGGASQATILVPHGFLASTSPQERTAALAHEMAHIARHDFALNLFAEFLLLPLGFHPAAWLLRRRLAEAREMACDEAATDRLLSPRAYASSLLSMAAACAGLPRPFPTLGVFDAGTLEVRMKRMTDVHPRTSARRARVHLSLAALLIAALGLAASGFSIAAVAGESTPAPTLKPFLGKWSGNFPADPKMQDPQRQQLPGAELEIALLDGKPQVVLTMYRLERNPDGTTQVLPLRWTSANPKVGGANLTFRIHREDFALPGEKPGPVDTDWSLEITGRGKGTLLTTWNSRFSPARERGENVPPPPPPLAMRKVS